MDIERKVTARKHVNIDSLNAGDHFEYGGTLYRLVRFAENVEPQPLESRYHAVIVKTGVVCVFCYKDDATFVTPVLNPKFSFEVVE